VALLTAIHNVFTRLHLSAYFHNLVLAIVPGGGHDVREEGR
jgi:hypothetical protein